MKDKSLSTAAGVNKLLERQMRFWELSREQRPPPPPAGPPQVRDFITISRMVGSGGSEVAAIVHERLGWPLFDREILAAMSHDDAIRQRLYASMDERDLGWLEESVRAVVQGEFVKNDYFHRLTESVLSLARQSSAIFLGRAADLMLPKDRGLRVRVVAGPERCIERYARRRSIGLAQARSEIERIEKERSEFIDRHFRIDAADQTRHDLIVNLDRFTPGQAADLVLSALRFRAEAAV